MTSDPPPSKPRPGAPSGSGAGAADPRAEREAKLAEALRANLRRRKAAPAPKAAKPGGDSA